MYSAHASRELCTTAHALDEIIHSIFLALPLWSHYIYF